MLIGELAGVAGGEPSLSLESELEGEAGFCRACPWVPGDHPGLLSGVDAAELDDGSGELMACRTLGSTAGLGEIAPIVLLVELVVVEGDVATVLVILVATFGPSLVCR